MKPTIAVILAAAATGGSTTSSTVPPAARAIVEKLRAGDPYGGNDADPFVEDGKIDDAALALLIDAFRNSSGDPRGELAHALVNVGKAGDEARPRGADALRDPRVITAMVVHGLSKTDGAKETCLDAMIKNVPAALLVPHGDALAASLSAGPDQTTALAVAKAKPASGLAALDKAAKATKWFRDSREAELLRAALGEGRAEGKVIAAFNGEKDPVKKRAFARELALVGTPATLKTLGSALRTPVVYETPSAVAYSQRLDILAALQIAYPDEPAVFTNTIHDDAGYARAEAFVEKQLGVTWSSARPPFLTMQGRPF